MCNLHPPDEACPALDVSGLVDEIVVAVSNARIYRADHPRVLTSVETLVSGLAAWLEARGRERLEIGTADGFLFHDHRPLLGASLSAPRIVEPLRRLGAGGLAFERGTGRADVEALVGFLAARRLEATTPDEANAALAQAGARRVRFLPAYRTDDLAGAARGTVAAVPAALVGADAFDGTLADAPLGPARGALYQDTVSLLQESAIGAARGADLALDRVQSTVERLLSCVLEDAGSMLSLARYERYDEFTFGHSIRVCVLALTLSASLTRDPRLLQRVGVAALLHDVGKARVPFEILHARGRLTEAERAEMARHTEHGADILLSLPDADPLAVAVALGHHRTPGGGGYPRLADDAPLSPVLRVVRICDVYEALTSVRPYKPRMSAVRAYRVMMNMHGEFDAGLLRHFIRVNGAYPVGTRVRLGSGEIARVTRQSADVERALVEVEVSAAGTRLTRGRRPQRDLSAGDGSELYLVREALAG